MEGPRTLEVSLSSYGYHMEIDVKKDDCERERTPHWHLCDRRSRLGSITAYGLWIKKPRVDRVIMREAEMLTSRYSSEIKQIYEHNRLYGAD